MASAEAEIDKFFAAPDSALPQDVMTELLHIMQLMSLTPEDLFYKWDSYVITMGADTTKLDFKTVRDFKKTLQDALEQDSRKKHNIKNESKRTAATPRAGGGGGDVFGMLDGMVSATPSARNAGPKRKAAGFDTPASKSVRSGLNSSPAGTPAINTTAFSDRTGAGEILQQINGHLPPITAPAEPQNLIFNRQGMGRKMFGTDDGCEQN